MNKKQLRKQLLERVYSGCDIMQIKQKKPYTMVSIHYVVPGTTIRHTVLGFSKVRWPDKWSEEMGVEIAKAKAAADIARFLLKHKYLSDILEKMEIEVEVESTVHLTRVAA